MAPCDPTAIALAALCTSWNTARILQLHSAIKGHPDATPYLYLDGVLNLGLLALMVWAATSTGRGLLRHFNRLATAALLTRMKQWLGIPDALLERLQIPSTQDWLVSLVEVVLFALICCWFWLSTLPWSLAPAIGLLRSVVAALMSIAMPIVLEKLIRNVGYEGEIASGSPIGQTGNESLQAAQVGRDQPSSKPAEAATAGGTCPAFAAPVFRRTAAACSNPKSSGDSLGTRDQSSSMAHAHTANTSSSLDVIRALVKAGGKRALYKSLHPRVVVTVKLHGAEPENLNTNSLEQINSEIRTHGYLVASAAVRPGCVELVLELQHSWHPSAACMPVDMDSAYEDVLGNLQLQQQQVAAHLMQAFIPPTWLFEALVDHSTLQSDVMPHEPKSLQVCMEGFVITCEYVGQDMYLEGVGSPFNSPTNSQERSWKVMRHEVPQSMLGRMPQLLPVSTPAVALVSKHGTVELLLQGQHLVCQGVQFLARHAGQYYHVTVLPRQAPAAMAAAHVAVAAETKNSQQVTVKVNGLPLGIRGLLSIDCRCTVGQEEAVHCGSAAVLLLSDGDAELADEMMPALASSSLLAQQADEQWSRVGGNALHDLVKDLGAWLEYQAWLEAASTAGSTADVYGNRLKTATVTRCIKPSSDSARNSSEYACCKALCSGASARQPPASTPAQHDPCDLSGQMYSLYRQDMVAVQMAELGLNLLAFAVQKGWRYTARHLYSGLVQQQGLHFSQIVALSADPAVSALVQPTLLHCAAQSGRWDMLQDVLSWGACHCHAWAWDQPDSSGATPLHLAAAAPDGGAFATALLRALPDLWLLWQPANPSRQTPWPADVAAAVGNCVPLPGSQPLRNDLEQCTAVHSLAVTPGQGMVAVLLSTFLLPAFLNSKLSDHAWLLSRGFREPCLEAQLLSYTSAITRKQTALWLVLSHLQSCVVVARKVWSREWSYVPAVLLWTLPYTVAGLAFTCWRQHFEWQRERFWLGTAWVRVVVKVWIALRLPVSPSVVDFCSNYLDVIVEGVMPGCCEQVRMSQLAPVLLVDAIAAFFMYYSLDIYPSVLGAVLHALLRLAIAFAVSAVLELRLRAYVLELNRKKVD